MRIVLSALVLALAGLLGVATCEETPLAALEPAPKLTLDRARQRAETLHEVYAATLEVMHDHYFHDARDTVPARALEDVFRELKGQSQVDARWISVNTRPMSINHEPKSEFEKVAAAALAKGEQKFDRVQNGYYERAGVIPLSDGCVGCHTGFFAGPPKSPRVAGLIIRMPVAEE